MKEKSDGSRFAAIGILLITVLLFAVFVLLVQSKNNTKNDNFASTNLSLGGKATSGQKGDMSGKYRDETCGVSFDYPKSWVMSNISLPLVPKPLSEVVFDEPGGKNSQPKKSILFFMCYDAKKYSLDQFIAQNPLKNSQTEVLTANSINWQRAGNFAYAAKNDKILIFQMFFTKYDLKPKTGYEEIFLDILKSVE